MVDMLLDSEKLFFFLFFPINNNDETILKMGMISSHSGFG